MTTITGRVRDLTIQLTVSFVALPEWEVVHYEFATSIRAQRLFVFSEHCQLDNGCAQGVAVLGRNDFMCTLHQ
jgi:hypothetical protein